ncbi:CfrBI family restriction endonuclease [Thermoanaerobacterium thermosaccharolyticum]|uniref:CfrBI family restriction endonuclease n=1 Tax=Thermoanaerobacterium thermosaccharolyticum TaxID=1517 RepID=UPI002FDB6687
MEELMATMINEILHGRDYRTYVLATINERFLKNVEDITKDIFYHKKNNEDWIKKILINTYDKKGKRNKFKLLWYGGLNEKTIKNITGTSQKKVCLELGLENIKSFEVLLSEAENLNPYKVNIIIKYKDESIKLNEFESLVYLNIVSTMKLTIQGGAWSEVGKMVEKSLMYTIFTLLQIDKSDFVLLFEEMKKNNLVSNREIDAIVFDRDKNPFTIEVKLLGIGNPEIGDEALARNVDLFITDRLTDMMINEANEKGIKVIELRSGDSLMKLYEFFIEKNIKCNKPEKMTEEDMKKKIKLIVEKWEYGKEEIKLLKKLKELTK